MTGQVSKSTPIAELFPKEALPLLQASGVDLIERLGLPAITEVVTNVLTGVNVRNATETLTRRRIALLNTAMMVMYLRATSEISDFTKRFPQNVHEEMAALSVSDPRRKPLQWLLGLTNKQVQNVLRSDSEAWDEYVAQYHEDMRALAEEVKKHYGGLKVKYGGKAAGKVELEWLQQLSLFVSIGAQTLATRGSEKSMYGKIFEKLVLGAVLHTLGFTLVEEDDISKPGAFWLSSRGKRRESDATVLVEAGKVIRFDIGFIGPGNTEISLDKVSRFERQTEIDGSGHFAQTIIIVDRIGEGSRIQALAERIDGVLIQMCQSDWPITLGTEIARAFPGYTSPFEGLSSEDAQKLVAEKVQSAPLPKILQVTEEIEEAPAAEPPESD